MLPVVRLSVPTPYPVGPVNCYLVKAKPYTLVDPGPNTEAAREALVKGLAAAGTDLERIERVVVTHGHSDHASLAPWVQSRSGAVVFAHPFEFPKLTGGFDIWREVDPFLRAGGMPEKVLAYLRATVDPVPATRTAPGAVSPLLGGERLTFDDLVLEVLHLPGHAVGHLGLFDRRGGDFLSGDFLLPDITPNPVMEPDPQNAGKRAKTLRQYLASLDRASALGARRVWPGHGRPFADVAATIDRIREHHAKRLSHILSFVGEDWLTPYQITGRVYPALDDFNVFLGFSEVVGHLDLLQERGCVLRRVDGGVCYFRRAPLAATKAG